MTTIPQPRKIHEGRNLKSLREISGMKQSTLAQILGNDWNQKKISQLEDKEVIDSEILDEVAKALKVTPEVIRNFNKDAALNIIQQNHEGANVTNSPNYQFNHECTFNPIDKWVEALEENKKLYEELIKEKEKLILSKDREIELLRQLLEKNKNIG